MGNQFRLAGHSLVAEAASADLVVINTCTVTAAAASDSRQKVRQAVKAGAPKVIVTGCYATVSSDDISLLPGAIQLVSNPDKANLVPIVLGLPNLNLGEPAAPRQPIPGSRLRTRAFIKVQDGCDNHCTYCITRLARGAGRSRRIPDVLADIQAALAGGSQEIVLTGVHLGSWGFEFDPPGYLEHLVRAILDATPVPRLHLSSIEPWDIVPGFLDLWQDARLCRHLHLPLQSGCAATLKRMGRKLTPASYAELVDQARQAIPYVSITTDIITGFPGETDQEFTESLAFVQRMNFAGGHVFTFSPRPGTAAAGLPGQVDSKVAKRRNALVRQAIQQSASTYRQQFIGHNLPVLWESCIPTNTHTWQLGGLSDNYLRVRSTSLASCHNQIMTVSISTVDQDSLVGEILLI